MRTKLNRSKWKVPIGFFLVVLIVAASIQYCSKMVSVSNSVNGRELPIYCVETKEKKVALSFDAACRNRRMRRRIRKAFG